MTRFRYAVGLAMCGTKDTTIRPFRVSIPNAALTGLRRRAEDAFDVVIPSLPGYGSP